MGVISGVEARVNSVTAGDQFEQRVVALEDGGWVVSWRTSGAFGITQQVYNADASFRGAATHADVTQNHGLMSLKGGGWVYVTSEEAFFFDNDGLASAPRDVEAFSASTFWDRSTDFAWLSGGGWVGYGYLESNGELGQNAYNHDGTTIVSEDQVNSTEEGYQSRPRYFGTEDGGWVVVWRSEYMAPEGPRYQVFSQAFNGDGTKRGDEVVAGTADGGLTGPFITELKDGTFITVWSERDATSGVSSIHQLHLDASGLPIGTETLVSSSQVPYDAEPRATALHGGGWVVTWKGVGQQVFNEDGEPVGDTVIAVQASNDGHEVIALDNGGWVVLHWSYGDIVQQIYSPSGTPVGDAQTVNTYTTYQQMNVDAAALPDGRWVVTWESANQDGSGTGVYQRTFQLTNDAPTVSNSVADQVGAEDQLFQFQLDATVFVDSDIDDSLTYAATLSNGSALPAWLSFDPSNRTFSGTPANGDVGTISVMVTATDTFGASASDTFEIAISNTNDAPTVANAIADHSAVEDEAFEMQFDASAFSDVDVGDTLTYSAVLSNGAALPSWLSFDAATRTFSGTPPTPGVFSIRVTATDGSNGSVSDTFSITVANTNDAPTGQSKSLSLVEDKPHAFGAADFGFADVDGDELAGITITSVAVTGSLTFNGVTVTAGQFVQTSDLGQLSWHAGKDVNGKGIEAFTFTLTDDGGTEHGGNNTSVDSYVIDFDVTEVVDRFNGTKKKDELVGTAGRDILDGKGGNDRLLGGLGNDTLTGGDGVDRFLFRTGDGRDTVKDFNAVGKAHDILDLSDLESVTSFKDLKRNHLDQAGKHVVIDGLNGDEIILQNVKIKDLDAGDFVF